MIRHWLPDLPLMAASFRFWEARLFAGQIPAQAGGRCSRQGHPKPGKDFRQISRRRLTLSLRLMLMLSLMCDLERAAIQNVRISDL